ncbi:MAG TPA: hypothetical protein VIK31_03530, partial [Propionibacteriaceae bacterium]
VGSTLTANIDAAATTIPVADATKFAANELVVMQGELLKITSVGASSITVLKRGVPFAAAAHSAGTRIASQTSPYTNNSVQFDMSTSCPLRDVGYGPETFASWNARRTATLYRAAGWNGLFIDNTFTTPWWIPNVGRGTVDQNRDNVADSFSAYSTVWTAGMSGWLASLRTLLGSDAALLTNGSLMASGVNGSLFETFPGGSTSLTSWKTIALGPRVSPDASYVQFCSNTTGPNVTSLLTFDSDGALPAVPAGQTEAWGHAGYAPNWYVPNYQKMRYGLTTALMADGFFCYEVAAQGGLGTEGLLWFDEYDNAGAGKGYLGQPTGPARLAASALAGTDLLAGDGSFDTAAQLAKWSLSYGDATYAANTALESGTARINVTAAAGQPGYLSLLHSVSLTSGTKYTLSFRARADRPLTMSLSLAKWSSPWNAWANFDSAVLDTSWRTFELPGTSSGTDPAAMLRIMLGGQVGTVWIDDVKLQTSSRPDVYRRDYDNGIALVNPTDAAVTVDLGGTFRKIRGTQAPAINDGSLVTAVTLQPRDGIVLLNVAAAVPAPSGTLVVAGGAPQVTSSSVTCVSSVTGATDMRIDPGSGTFGAWTAYAASAQITLAGTPGTKIVRVEYRNATGTIQLTDTIELVAAAPTPAPTETPTPIATETPAPTPVATVTPAPVPAPVATVTPTPAPTPVPVVEPTPDPDPTPAPIDLSNPPAAATATITASAMTITYGQSTTLRVVAAPASILAIRIESRTAADPVWTQVATMTTSIGGTAQLAVEPLVTTEYRLVLVDSGVASNVVTVGVKPATTIRSNKRIVRKSSHVLVSGVVTASSIGTVVLQRRTAHGRWATIKRLTRSATGRYRVHVGWSKRGTYSYRIVVAASLVQRSASSKVVRVRVH